MARPTKPLASVTDKLSARTQHACSGSAPRTLQAAHVCGWSSSVGVHEHGYSTTDGVLERWTRAVVGDRVRAIITLTLTRNNVPNAASRTYGALSLAFLYGGVTSEIMTTYSFPVVVGNSANRVTVTALRSSAIIICNPMLLVQ